MITGGLISGGLMFSGLKSSGLKSGGLMSGGPIIKQIATKKGKDINRPRKYELPRKNISMTL